MKRFRWKLLLAVAALVVVVGVVLMRNNRRSAVDNYKTELRAKGEKISFAELGFPRQPENGEGLRRLTNAVDRIRSNNNFYPGEITMMKFVAPGRVRVSWRSPEVMLSSNQATNWLGWEKLRTHFDGASNDLIEVRTAVKQPIRWFMHDPEQMGFMIRYPFVPIRSAAQWLCGDGISALQTGDRIRVLQDIHALAQLTEFNKEDPTLVAQMIRVAIAELGLNMTWEALQNPDWAEDELFAMQMDWERADLLSTLEIGFLGERASGERFFNLIRTNGARQMLRIIAPPKSNSRWNDIEVYFTAAMWRINAEQDEMLAFTHYQGVVECVRDMKQKPWAQIRDCSTDLFDKLDRQMASTGLNRYRHLFSSMTIPSHTSALLTAERQETWRRLTITAIALKRFQLRHRKSPTELNELVPEFISAVPVDPMNIQPLRYKLNADGTFVLYSVGEDGKDDGGDPTPTNPKSPPDLWNARDAVWPVAVENTNGLSPVIKE